MTPCENYWEALNAFVDGECSPEEEAALRAHLADCAACREALAELTALHDGFPDWEDEAVPEGFADGVLQKIAETPQQAPKKGKRKRSGAAWASWSCWVPSSPASGAPVPPTTPPPPVAPP